MNKILFNGNENVKLPENISLDIQGDGHTINLNKFSGNGHLKIKLRGNNCNISFGKNNTIEKGVLSINGYNYPNKKCNGSCIIGDNNKFRGNLAIYIPLNKSNKVEIGCNNLFATNCEIIGCTEHPVYDFNHNLLNKECDVNIGNHNWIGRDVLFLNKSGIKNDSVVGIRSLVTKKFENSNIIIAGSPAKIRKTEIIWKEEHE